MTRGVAGVILAGGLSRRMGGGDKCLVHLGGRPILERVIERLRPQVEALALNANGDPGRFAGYGLPVLPDSIEGNVGPLAGVLAGMDWAAGLGFDTLVSVAADTPFFPETLVEDLRAAARDDGAKLAVAMTEDVERGHSPHPTFGLWSVDLREDLRAAVQGGMRRVVDWTARHGPAQATFRMSGQPFFNINRPEDLARAETMLAERAG